MNKGNALKISNYLSQFNEIDQIILYGSVNNANVEKDICSDCDIGIIVNNFDVAIFYYPAHWLNNFNKLFAYEKHLNETTVTLRVCFNDFSKYDLVFVDRSSLSDKNNLSNIFGKNYSTLFSRKKYSKNSISLKNQIYNKFNIDNDYSINAFWYVATVALCKILRNDYLIAGHLILKLMQETIVLQMRERDKIKGTNVHRYGNAEKINIFEKINNFDFNHDKNSLKQLLTIVCKLYDKQILDINKSYTSKYNIFKKWI
jgi:hypothetical protein